MLIPLIPVHIPIHQPASWSRFNSNSDRWIEPRPVLKFWILHSPGWPGLRRAAGGCSPAASSQDNAAAPCQDVPLWGLIPDTAPTAALEESAWQHNTKTQRERSHLQAWQHIWCRQTGNQQLPFSVSLTADFPASEDLCVLTGRDEGSTQTCSFPV